MTSAPFGLCGIIYKLADELLLELLWKDIETPNYKDSL
jgi:hypothetical protein